MPRKEGFKPDDLNERGKWLLSEKDKQQAKEIKADWLKNYTDAKVNVVARLAGLLLVLLPGMVEAQGGAPLPHGWIGTTSQWLRGLGVAFALLGLVLLAFAWRSLRAGTITGTARGWLFVSVGLVPRDGGLSLLRPRSRGERDGVVVRLVPHYDPFVQDLRNVKSDTLAATHFKNRYIRENQCFNCHSDYGLGGTIKAKFEGLGHVWRYTTGRYQTPIKLTQPFPNTRCLACHAESQKFLNSDGHPKEAMHDLMDGTVSCIACHGPAHPEQKKEARR